MRTTKQVLVLLAVGLGSAPARGQMEARRNLTDANPYGDAPSNATTSEKARFVSTIDASNPYAFAGGSLPERALPRLVVFRDLDVENPYGAGLAAVERAPIDTENPYGTARTK